MRVLGIDKQPCPVLPFVGGPMSGKFLILRGEKFPRKVRVTMQGIIEHYDDDKGSLCGEWEKTDTEYLGTVNYQWSGGAYVPESEKREND